MRFVWITYVSDLSLHKFSYDKYDLLFSHVHSLVFNTSLLIITWILFQWRLLIVLVSDGNNKFSKKLKCGSRIVTAQRRSRLMSLQWDYFKLMICSDYYE